MANVTVTRARCYLVAQGIERSLAENIVQNLDVDESDFLARAEKEGALKRLREDMKDPDWESDAWGLDDVTNEELLQYLSIAELVSILKRHSSNVKDAKASEVQSAIDVVEGRDFYSIRNRIMHPVRPIETDDFPTLIGIAEDIRSVAPNLIWNPLIEAIKETESPFGVDIPTFWEESSRIPHNLPAAEFDDTGFIGRRRERDTVKRHIASHRNVITIVGAGGLGKTALALRVCHDILDDPQSEIERIVWVSLKTTQLTSSGVQEISHAVSNRDDLIDEIDRALGADDGDGASTNWDSVLAHAKDNHILLIIDNLETLGGGIVDLATDFPLESTLLLTSRIGLGQIEVPYSMPDFSGRDAGRLMRQLAAGYNCTAISELGHDRLMDYCKRLSFNPLGIKVFVQTVARGFSPESVLSDAHQADTQVNINEFLTYCWGQVYDSLSDDLRNIVAHMLAANRELSRTQIQELVEMDYVSLEKHLQELQQCNILETVRSQDPRDSHQMLYRLGNFAIDFLRRNHPPENRVVRNTLSQITTWQLEQETNERQQNSYRYAQIRVHAESRDEQIVARHLSNALRTISRYRKSEEVKKAEYAERARKSLSNAESHLPNWWEVHRVKAHFFETVEGRPIFDIRNAFETSIACKSDSDISLYHYATYLVRIGQFDSALEQIEVALGCPDAEELSLRSYKGLCLTLLGRYPEAIEEHDFCWTYMDDDTPPHFNRIRGTRYAESLRRYVEFLRRHEDPKKALEYLSKGFAIAEDVASRCRWDEHLAKVGVQLGSELLAMGIIPDSSTQPLYQKVAKWDWDRNFVDICRGSNKVQYRFSRSEPLRAAMPNSSSTGMVDTRLFRGSVSRVGDRFGFIKCQDFEEALRIYPNSLAIPGDWDYLLEGLEVEFQIEYQFRVGTPPNSTFRVVQLSWAAPKDHLYQGSIGRLVARSEVEGGPYGFIGDIKPALPFESIYMNPSSLSCPSEWEGLELNERVTMTLVSARPGPRAIGVRRTRTQSSTN